MKLWAILNFCFELPLETYTLITRGLLCNIASRAEQKFTTSTVLESHAVAWDTGKLCLYEIDKKTKKQ